MYTKVASFARHPWRWLLLMGILALGGAWLGTAMRLPADLLSMLPGDVPAARAYRTLLEEFGGLERIFVVVSHQADSTAGREASSSDSAESRVLDAALELEERLAREPLIAGVRAGVEPEDERFLFEYVVPREVLRNSEWTIDRIADRLTEVSIAKRVQLLRDKIRSPAGEFDVRLARFDPLGFAESSLLTRASELGLSVDPLSGVFRSEQGSALLMLEPKASELDSVVGRELADALARIFAEVQIMMGPGISITAAGGPLYAAEDEELIRSDLEWTISLSVAGCLLVLLLAFGSWRATVVASFVLAGAFALAFGTLVLLRGEMLAVSLGFAAVLVGLGIDYVIHAITRFRQSLESGADAEAALMEVARESGPPLVASSFTTAAAFAVLLGSAMRPLVEVGLLVSVGIVMMMVCTAVVGGPLMALLIKVPVRPGRRVGGRLAWLWRPSQLVPQAMTRFSRRRSWAVLGVTALVLLMSLWSARGLRFEPKFEDLRPDDHPLELTERQLVQEFGLEEDSVTVLVQGETVDQALARSESIVRFLEDPENPLLGEIQRSVSSPSTVLMAEAALSERLSELSELPWAEAATRLERLLPEAGLSARGFGPGLAVLRDFAGGREPRAGADLAKPDWVTSQFQLREDGTALVAIRVRTDPEGSRVLATDAVAEALQSLVEGSETVTVASAFALGEQLRVVGEREVGVLALASLGVVLLVVSISLGFSPMATVIALLPIGIGATAAFGFLGVTAGHLDFLSLAIVPMLFGIGIDDGLHALCGAVPKGYRGLGLSRREHRRRLLSSMLKRIDGASRAITLTTVTTAVGFGSLLASSMPGLRVGGMIVAVGVCACWLATVMVLPALATVLLGPEPSGEDPQQIGTLAPETRWRSALGVLHFSSPVWYRLHALLMRLLPSWAISVIMLPVLAAFYLLLGNVRRALLVNQRAASQGRTTGLLGAHRRAFATLTNFAWCFSETYEGLFDPQTRSVASVEGVENWQTVMADGRGFIIVTAHVGHWEVGSHLSKFDRPRKVNVVREPEMNPRAQAFLEELFGRDDSGHYQVHFARPEDPMLGGRLLSALRRGEIVALQGDRPRADGKTVAVELLDRSYELPVGPFAMARAACVSILPVFVFRDGRRRSALHLREPIIVDRTRVRDTDFAKAASQFAVEVEWAITQRPQQWFCLRKLWDE